MMNKSLRGRRRESSRIRKYGFQRARTKKSRRFRRLLKLITGRRQTEWTGATRCPNEDRHSHNRESLIDRKRAVFFRVRLPCRPLAEFGSRAPDAAQRDSGALLIRGPTCLTEWGPGSAEQRYALHRVRDTSSRLEKAV